MKKQYCVRRVLAAVGCCTALTGAAWAQLAPPRQELTEFEMRGLPSTGGESPTVGFYLDDAVLTPAAMAQNGKTVIDPSLFDLNRVQVLRGRQGTLYGG